MQLKVLLLLALLLLLAVVRVPSAHAMSVADADGSVEDADGESATDSDGGEAVEGEDGQSLQEADVQDSPQPVASADEEGGEVPAGPAESEGRVTIVDNSNHLNAIAEKKHFDEATEARMEAQKLERHQEQHEKKLEAYKREQAEEQNMKRELDLKQKARMTKEAGEKTVQREQENKKQAEQAAKQKAEQAQKAAAKAKAERESEAKKKQNAAKEAVAKKNKNKWGAHWWRRPGWWGGFHHAWRQKISHVHSRPYGHSYETPHFFRWNGHCTGAGLTSVWGNYVGRSPSHCRPHNGRLIFAQHAGRESRVDILPDGRIYHITGRSASWLSLDGMSFHVSRPHGVWLGWGWRYYGSSYRAGTQSNVGNLCAVSGLMRGSHWGYIGRVMGSCYPNGGRLIFSGNNHHHITRLDVLTNGYIVRSGGYTSHGWVSFDGMVYPRYQGSAVSFYHGWTHYHHGYRYGNYRRIGPICVLSGLIKTWTRSSQILRLPSGCRPRARLLFGANTHNHDARVDILPDGRVLNVARLSGHNWVSLSGISFIAYN